MRRKLFNLAATLSLALCVATVVLWLRSYRTADVFVRVLYRPDVRILSEQSVTSFQGRTGVRLRDTKILDDTLAEDMEMARTEGEYNGKWSHRGTALRPDEEPDFLARLGFVQTNTSGRFIPSGPEVGADRIRAHSWFERRVGLPHWFLATTFALMPAWRITRLARRRGRVAFGLCPSCGYDLRASPERCPECGTATATPKVIA